MKLWITPKSSFEGRLKHGHPLSRAVKREKLFDSLAIAEIHQRNSCLLLEQAAQPRRAQARMASEFVQTDSIISVADVTCGFIIGWMDVLDCDIGGVFEVLLRGEERIAEPGIEQTGLPTRGGNF